MTRFLRQKGGYVAHAPKNKRSAKDKPPIRPARFPPLAQHRRAIPSDHRCTVLCSRHSQLNLPPLLYSPSPLVTAKTCALRLLGLSAVRDVYPLTARILTSVLSLHDPVTPERTTPTLAPPLRQSHVDIPLCPLAAVQRHSDGVRGLFHGPFLLHLHRRCGGRLIATFFFFFFVSLHTGGCRMDGRIQP